MMDFNLILLLVGMGLLVLVVVFALLGFFAGLKKELKCTAIAFVLILLALLVYGDSSTILNASSGVLKSVLTDFPATASTIWDVVVYYAQTKIPGGTELFVEGSKSYAFLYDVVGGLARGVMLLVGTLLIFIITLIANGIFRLVTRIVASNKAKKKAASGVVQEQATTDKNIQDNVLVAKNENGETEGVVITTSKVPESNKKSKHRGWAALLAGVRCVIVILFLFAPISGVCTVLDSISPKTEELINSTLTGTKNETATVVANSANSTSSNTALDMAMEFKDSYYDSAIGKFVEGSSFFFKDSISTKLFDSAFTIQTDTDNIKIRDEVLVVLNAVNALEGNTKLDSLSQKELNSALDALKDSKLITAAMPVAIEVAYYYPLNDNSDTLGKYLTAAGQQAVFLQLRNADWNKNVSILLDTVKEAYKLGFLNDDFNVLTMDEKTLKNVVDLLAQSDVVCTLLNVAVPTALNVDKVVDLIGKLPKNPDMSVVNWQKELNAIVDVYATFKELGITSLKDIDYNQLIQDTLNDEEQFDIVADIISQVFKLQLMNEVGLDVAFNYVANIEHVKDAGYKVTKAVKELADLDWESDIKVYLEAVKTALPMLDFSQGLVPDVNLLDLDADILSQVVDQLFTTESFEKILPIATNVALALPSVKQLTGDYDIVIDTSKIDWKLDFTKLVSIYEEFLKLNVKELSDITTDVFKFAHKTFSSDVDIIVVSDILDQLASLDLFVNVVVPFGNSYGKNLLASNNFDVNFVDLIDLTTLTKTEWQEDFRQIVKIAVNADRVCQFQFDLESFDLSEDGLERFKTMLTSALNLKLLADDEFKNALVKEVLKVTKVFDEEAIESMDFSEVVWLDGTDNEHNNLQAIIDYVIELSSVDGFDLDQLHLDFNKLLRNQAFVDHIISILEVVSDSNLILEVFPAAIDKFVIPQIEKFDDEEGTLNDVIKHLDSKELVLEVEKLVVAFKSAIELGIFDISEDLNSFNFNNTDAMRTIVNAIFDSKILEGYEARVIRLALKLTKVFPDIEKGIFDGIDFDREQQILISFIDNLEVVLTDPDFSIVENNTFKLDEEFFTREDTLNAFIKALNTLFGKYSQTEETAGSELLERVLPLAVETYALPKIPDEFEELVSIFDLEKPNQEALASDIRRIIYVFELAVDMKVQRYVNEKDYDFSQSLASVNEIVEVLFNLHHIKGNEAKAVAWGLNYAQTSLKLDVATFTEADFATVNWDDEVTNFQGVITTLYDIVNHNDIATVSKLASFIKDRKYLNESFLNNDNAEYALQLLEKVVSLQTLEQILPFGLDYALKLAKDHNFDLSFIGNNMTAELLAEDLLSIVDALRIAVEDLNIVDYYNAKWTGALPEIEPVLAILDIIVDLNLVNGRENQLLKFVVEKYLPANDFVKVSDLDFSYEFDFDNEWEIIKNALRTIYPFFSLNNMDTLEAVKTFINEKQYMPIDGLLTDDNLLLVADVLEVVSDSKLVKDALVAAIKNGVELDKVTKIGNFRSLRNLTKTELASDIKTVAKMIRAAVELDVVTLYFEKDLVIDYNQVAVILDLVGDLNVINKCASSIIPEVLNYVLSSNNKLEFNHKFTNSEFSFINFKEEMTLFGDALIECGELFNAINLDSLQDILTFIKNGDYKNETVLTTENANLLLNAVDLLAQSQLLEAVSVSALEYGVDFAAKKNIDLSFLNGALTHQELGSDLRVIAEILHNVVNFGAVDYLCKQDINPLEMDYVVNVVALLDELNLLTKTAPQWTALAAKYVVDKLKVDVSILSSTYEKIDYTNENQLLQQAIKEIAKLLANENLESIQEIKDYVSNQYFKDINTYNDAAIDNVQNLVRIIAQSEVIKVNLSSLLDFGAKLLGEKLNMDLSFVEGKLTNEEVASDLNKLVDISEYAVEFGIVELIFDKDLTEIDLQPVIELVRLFEEVNLLVKCNKEITALAFNKGLAYLNINKEVYASDFNHVNYANENQLLRAALTAVNGLLVEFNLNSVANIKDFVESKGYMKSENYSEQSYTYLSNLSDTLLASQIAVFTLPIALDYAVDKLENSNLDLTYLKGTLTGEELASDLRIVLDEAIWWLETGEILQAIENKAIKSTHLDDLANTLSRLDDTHLYNVDPLQFTVNVTNFIASIIKYDGRVDETYFSTVNNWQKENEKVYIVLRALNDIVETFGVDNNLLSLDNLKEFTKSGYKNKEIYTEELLVNVEAVLSAVADANVLVSELVFGHEYLVSVLATKDIYIDNTLVEANLLAKDFDTLASFVQAIVAVDALDYVVNNGQLNQRYVEKFANALVNVLKMNVLSANGAKENLAVIGFEKLGVNVSYNDLYPINWDEELVTIKDIILSANEALHTFNLDTLDSFKSFDYKSYLNINDETNKYLYIIAEVLENVGSSQLVEKLVLPLSEKYLASENVTGYADLHNIYENGYEVVSDLNKLASAIYSLRDLDFNSFINGDAVIPYENTAAINNIIRSIFSLGYLNNNEHLVTLMTKISKMDLSGIDASKLNLEGDGELLVEMYDNLLTVLSDDEFFLKDKNDLKNMVINVRYWSQEKYVDAMKDAAHNFFDTTLVSETNGAVFAVLVPILKQALPDVYEALDPESLSFEQLKADGNALVAILKDVINADLSSILSGKYITPEVETLITNTIDRLSNLNLLAGHGAALANVIAKRLDTKKVGNVVFNASDYEFDAVNYYDDAQVLINIVHEVFAFLYRQNISTGNDLADYVESLKGSLKDELAEAGNLESIESILGYITELTIVKYNGLTLYNLFGEKELAKVTNNELANLSSVYADSLELHADLVKVHQIFAKLIEAGLADIIGGQTINYDQAELVKEILNQAAEIKYLNELLVELVAFVDTKVNQVDLSSIDFSQVDLSNDLSIVGNVYEQLIPVLLSNHNPFTTYDAFKAGSIKKSDLYALIYDYQSIYPSVIELASNITIAPQLFKYIYNKVEPKLSGNVATIVQVLNIDTMNDAELREDLVVIADALGKVESLDLLRYVLYKDDVEITDNDTIALLISDLFKLHMVDNNFTELVKTTIETTVNVNLSVDLSTIDEEVEQELLVELVNNVVVVLNSLDVVYLKEVKTYVKDLVSSLKTDVKDGTELLKDQQFKAGLKTLTNTLLEEARKANTEVCVEVIEQLCTSEIFVKVLLPIYQQKVVNKLDGVLATIGDIHDYNEEQLSTDLELVARIARNIYDSGIYTFATTKVLLDKDYCVPYLEAAIKDICNLTILDLKKQDFTLIAQEILESVGLVDAIKQVDKDFDLTKFDCSSINFTLDADQYALMAPYGYDVLQGLVESGFSMAIFGNTKLMNALVEIYTISIDTTAMTVIGDKGLGIVRKVAERYGMTVNADDKAVLNNISEFLFGLVEIGVFSNDGIDFTKTTVINGMVDNLYDSITLSGKVKSMIDRINSRVDAFGVVPFNWTEISAQNEAKVAIDVVKLLAEFIKDHKDMIQAKDLSILADPHAQAKLTDIINRIADSGFTKQLFFPIVEGTFKVFTLNYTDGTMTYTATLDDVLNTSVPNMWTFLTAVYNLTGFKTSGALEKVVTNASELKPIVEVLTTDVMLKDNVAKILATFIGKFSSYDLTLEEVAELESVDFVAEKGYLFNAIDKLQATYDATHFEVNTSALKDPVVLEGVADALEELVDSKTLEILINKVMSFANNRVIKKVSTELADVVKDRLTDDAYTNALAMADFELAVSVLKNIALSSVLNNKDDFNSWNYAALEDAINQVFATNIMNGYEDEFCKTIIEKVPYLKDYYEDDMVITDWQNEFIAAIKALESLTADGITSLDNIDVANLSANTIAYVCESEMLKSIVVEEINNKLIELNIDAYIVTVADLDTVSSWDNEKQALDNLIDLMDMIKNELNASQYDTVAGYYRYIRNYTTLVNKVVVANGAYVVSQMPIVKEYDHLVDTSLWTSLDWENELDAIVNAVDDFDLGNVSTDKELVITLSGENIRKSLKSEILAAGIAYEFNKKLSSLGLEYTVTVAELTDSSLDWDVEKTAINNLVDLMNMINTGTLSYNQYETVANYYRTTKLASFTYNIVLSCGDFIVQKMPVVKDYYPLVDTTSWNKAKWAVELDAVVDTISALNGATKDTMENPIDNLNATVINAAFGSDILTAGFVKEFNKNLEEIGVDLTYDASTLKAATDWETELEFIRATKTLMNDINNAGSLTPELINRINALQTAVQSTVIAKEIFEAGLTSSI